MNRPNEKILLVDDEPRLLAGLRRRLSDRFHVLSAESAAEAICMLESGEPIGAIVADMRMPERDGIDLLVEVERRWPNIRRLMLTGNADQETAIAAVNQGRVFRFFRKPCDADELAAALNEALEEYRFVMRSAKERHALEARAASGERARRSFLSMMSHELLTPLNHVLGFTSVLEMKLRQKDESDALEYLNHIRDSGESLLRMVHRVLEVARLMSEDLRRDRQIVDVGAVISEALDKIRPNADAQKITISFQSPPSPVLAEVSDYDLRFVLAELLDNAVKFNKKGGHISVAISAADDQLAIRIADTGIGISEGSIERSTNLFTQGDDADNRRFDGVGLGLSFGVLFARANDGDLAVEGREGNGTAVMLTIGRAHEPGMAAARSA